MEELKAGDLVFLTKAYEDSFKRKNPTSEISVANRLAKLEEIIDWESAKGKKIKQARQESGKWNNLPLEENKYILSIFYPELIGRKNQKGVVERGVPMFQFDPNTKEPLFEKVPDWIFKEILKKCEVFDIQMKTPSL